MARRPTFNETEKQRILDAMFAEGAPSVMEISRKFGVSPPTLYKWKQETTMAAKARHGNGGRIAEGGGALNPEESIRVRSFSASGEVETLRARVAELERELAKRNGQLVDLLLRARED